MHFFNKRPKIFKLTCMTAIITSAGWLYYQVRKTRCILDNAFDSSILTIMEPEFSKRKDTPEYFMIGPPHDQERTYSLDKPWNSLKFALAKRLSTLANNENKFIRSKAVRQLAKIKTLEDWQFAIISNIIDARTAVGLARTEHASPRFFIEPPLRYFTYTKNMLVEVMKELLVSLHAKSQHPCVGYFISKVFADVHDVARIVDHDHAPMELTKFIQAQSTQDVLPLCLESLLHHASIGKYSRDIAEFNGLPLLMEISHRFRDNLEITATISRIMSYLSLNHDLLEDLFKSGWIGVLAEWKDHEDVRIAIPAAKALANLDLDEDAIYRQRLYPLHPLTRTTQKPDADIIFVHGLMGGVFFTWRQRDKKRETLGLIGKKGRKESLMPSDSPPLSPPAKKRKRKNTSDPNTKQFMEDLERELRDDLVCKDYEVVWEDIPTNVHLESTGPYACSGDKYTCCNDDDESYTYCWPRDWLAEDCDNLRIIGVNYETNLSLWAPICPTEKVKNLEARCDELLEQLMGVGLGKRPIIWITHSMGGLLVKNLLCKAFESQDKEIWKMCLNTKGLVFYSTPHIGSSVASFNQASALVFWPSLEVQELQENSSKLLEIHDKFLDINKKLDMKVVTFVETKATIVTAMKFKFRIVEPHSGNPGIGEYYEIPQDHLGICKPSSRYSFLYQKVLHLIQDILQDNKPI